MDTNLPGGHTDFKDDKTVCYGPYLETQKSNLVQSLIPVMHLITSGMQITRQLHYFPFWQYLIQRDAEQNSFVRINCFVL